MNRREFLKLLGYGSVALTIPVTSIAKIDTDIKHDFSDVKVIAEYMQYNQRIGIGVDVGKGNQRWRHAFEVNLEELDNKNATKGITDILNEWLATKNKRIKEQDVINALAKI